MRQPAADEVGEFLEPFLDLLDDEVDKEREGLLVEVLEEPSDLSELLLQDCIHFLCAYRHDAMEHVFLMELLIQEPRDEHPDHEHERGKEYD